MDTVLDELSLRAHANELRRQSLELARSEASRSERDGTRNRRTTAISTVLSALAIIASVCVATVQIVDAQHEQSADAAQRLRATLQANYDAMVQELGSSSYAVQLNAIRRLVQFVEDRHRENYPQNACDQWFAAGNLAQTLEEYITTTRDSDAAKRTAQQLRLLTSQGDVPAPPSGHADCNGGHDVSLNSVDLDYVDLSGWVLPPATHFGLYSVSLRGASLARLDLRRTGYVPSLQNSDLRCADLSDAQLGRADLRGTDLRGADLRGADLSATTGLDSINQLAGASVNARTKLPRIDSSSLLRDQIPASTIKC
jgi:hypothetical protein